MNLTRRPRRLRRTAQIRNLVHEVDVRCDDLIYPVFVTEGENVQSPIESMPGIYHYSLDRLAIHLKEVWEKNKVIGLCKGCGDVPCLANYYHHNVEIREKVDAINYDSKQTYNNY